MKFLLKFRLKKSDFFHFTMLSPTYSNGSMISLIRIDSITADHSLDTLRRNRGYDLTMIDAGDTIAVA
jgi:hypothetical protein